MHIYFIYPPFVLHMYIYVYIYIFLSKTDFVCVNPSGKDLKLAMPLGSTVQVRTFIRRFTVIVPWLWEQPVTSSSVALVN